MDRIFFISKIKTDSVNCADSDTKILVQCPGNSISEFSTNFCVSGVDMRGRILTRNYKKWIFDIQYPGNWFEFGIISNDF